RYAAPIPRPRRNRAPSGGIWPPLISRARLRTVAPVDFDVARFACMDGAPGSCRLNSITTLQACEWRPEWPLGQIASRRFGADDRTLVTRSARLGADPPAPDRRGRPGRPRPGPVGSARPAGTRPAARRARRRPGAGPGG